jgi:LPS export ABC transporter protein LptC
MMRLITARNLIILVIILITIWLTLRVLRDSRVLEPEATLALIPENVDLTLKNIKYTKSHAGKPLWTLKADSAAHSMEDGITRVKNVHIVFFDREVGDLELTAELGELMPEYRIVTVSSNVMVTSASGDSLLTDYLEYEESSKILRTDRVVKFNTDYFMVSGKGMRMDIGERTLVLLNDVKAQFGERDSLLDQHCKKGICFVNSREKTE